MSRPRHGGNVDHIAETYGVPPETLLDFSANVRPGGLPSRLAADLAAKIQQPGFLARYPDGEYRELRARIAERVGVDAACVVLTGGATAAIRHVFAAIGSETAVVPIPAFSEYGAAAAASRTDVVPLALKPEDGFRLHPERARRVLRRRCPGLLVVNNPHNPSGVLTHREDVLSILATTRRLGATLVVDEAFIDYAPAESVVGEVEGGGVVVVRSLTKFYGIAGARIGYALASPELVPAIEAHVPSWPSGRLDVAAALAALDTSDDEATRSDNAVARERLEKKLRDLGLEVSDSRASFLLFRLSDSMPPSIELFERLVREHGIVVRECSSYDGLEPERYVRVAVRAAEDNDRLAAALETILIGRRST